MFDGLDDLIAEAIDRAYDAEPPEAPRSYIGASNIGHPCDAYVAFSLRGYPESPPPARLKRIFRDGHRIEATTIYDLKKAGLRVYDRDGLTGRQFRYEMFGGHVVCNMDGHIDLEDGTPIMVLEIKSMNAASWKKFFDFGVRVSHPRYFAQMQMMMGMSLIGRSMFVAYNKDTSAYHSEIVAFDEFEWAAIQAKIERVLMGQARKVATDRADWRCKDCFKRGVCWEGVEPPVSCKTCAHAHPTADGLWYCGLHKKDATETCGDYALYHPLPRT